MTEADYILAKNLARVRLAMHAVGSLFAETNGDVAKKDEAMAALGAIERRWQDKLEKRKAGGK